MGTHEMTIREIIQITANEYTVEVLNKTVPIDVHITVTETII